jgi:hypothetical protein
MLDQDMAGPLDGEEEGMPEGEEGMEGVEICVHVLPSGELDVDGEPASDMGALLKLVMAKVKAAQAGASGDEAGAMQAGFERVRGS